MMNSLAPATPIISQLIRPFVNNEQAEKINEINIKIQQFLDHPHKEKIYLVEPELKDNLISVMNPDLPRFSRESGPLTTNLKNPFIHLPRAIYSYSSNYFDGYQFIDYDVFMDNSLSVLHEIHWISQRIFNGIEVEKFLKQARAIIKQIDRGMHKIEFLVKELPCLMNQVSPIDLKALFASLNNCVAIDQYLADKLMHLCLETVKRLDCENICFNELIDLKSPISRDFPILPVSLPEDKYFFDYSEKEILSSQGLHPITRAPLSPHSLKPAWRAYFQTLLSIFKTGIQDNKRATHIIGEEFYKGAFYWNSYVKDINEAFNEVKNILKVIPQIGNRHGEISFLHINLNQKNPLESERISVIVEYVSEVLARNHFILNKSFDSPVLLIQLAKQIEKACKPILFDQKLRDPNQNVKPIESVGNSRRRLIVSDLVAERIKFFESPSSSETPLSENTPQRRSS